MFWGLKWIQKTIFFKDSHFCGCKFPGRCCHCMYILGKINSYNNFYKKVPCVIWQLVFVKDYLAT